MLRLSILLGLLAALADIAGGLVLVRAQGIEKYLRYFVALGAGFLMATAMLEMAPESLKLSPKFGPILIMAGYCAVHFLEHTINAHFHYGEETHHHEFVSHRTGYAVLTGLSVHALFDGVAIGSGFVVSNTLGWLIFLAIFLHKAPEGFTIASVMLAAGRSRREAFYSAVALAIATLAGVLVIELAPHWLPYGLPISAGVAFYVGASDLVPEVNREPGIRMALVFFLGVAGFLLLRMLLPAL
ncbi:ZIP family metal transporter [Occallatibacter riparius]|uniref:ZIP family metal transporter n=1 Tax=Occallatibacter riparius TaxID=1002689 RepID=A0A9J7BL49_9BACT|nr:ZIP family metal transporter [Occallatibacter riparius]UWZ83339.1 ZIP family metal transporter [Occallatibacter riparius]